jgi:ubiquinone/menaquinone biosynthesis C-methylase UbiE/uncharacterized protein YbaR (Trm112 family)
LRLDVIPLLRCPVCESGELEHSTFKKTLPQEIWDGVIWCKRCRNWFPIQDGLLELLTGKLAYLEDRNKFWNLFSRQLKRIGLNPNQMTDNGNKDLQLKQQTHFDWYANNQVQTYEKYQQQQFWKATDWLTFEPWQKNMVTDSWLLDIGCAEGRSTFNFLNQDINVIGFDVSKPLVRQAINRYQSGNYKARATFFLADANKLPFKNNSFDYVLIYGVLHHVPNPTSTCKEAARVLKLSGKYFGSENNHSLFRAIFDFMQKRIPLWHEEAGPEALIDRNLILKAFNETGVEIKTFTSVFVLPHLINLMPLNLAKKVLYYTDKIGKAIPFLRQNGGLIIINGTKTTGE